MDSPTACMDFISDLTEELKCKILCFLSIKDAAQTSVLSSSWRNTWSLLKEISIRESDFIYPDLAPLQTRIRFIEIVNKLLFHPNRKLKIFEVEFDKQYLLDYHTPDFDHWIGRLSTMEELSKLSLYLHKGNDLYKLPIAFYSCSELSSLKLGACLIELPIGFEGFKSMRVLELEGCCISANDLEKILSSCPILDEFTMKPGDRLYYPSEHFKIRAPKLKKLIIIGKFETLLLETPCLVKAHIELLYRPTGIHGSLLVEALGSLQEVEALGLHNKFLMYLAEGSLPTYLPVPGALWKLGFLALDVNLASSREASVTRFLLQNAPNLRELKLINSFLSSFEAYAEQWEIGSSVKFMSLQVIEIHCHFSENSEIAFLQCIVGSAPFLKQLKVRALRFTDDREKETIDAKLNETVPIQCTLTIEWWKDF